MSQQERKQIAERRLRGGERSQETSKPSRNQRK